MFQAASFTADTRRNTVHEDEALRWLRTQPESLRRQFVCQLIAQGYGGALEFVRRAQLSPESLEALFRDGLTVADASTIRLWLVAVLAGLGWQRVLELLWAHLPVNSKRVEQALYWLPRLLSSEDAEAQQGLHDLQVACQQAA